MKPATATATLLLLLVATAHALRLVLGLPVTVGTTSIPLWASVVGTIVPGILAIGLWREHLARPGTAG